MAKEQITSYVARFTYARELREALEAPNRETIAAIFAAKREDTRFRDMLSGHTSGIHWPGFCPWCPPNVYHD